MEQLKQESWKEDHLQRKHTQYYDWCVLCMNKKKGEESGSSGGSIQITTSETINLKDVGPGGVK